MHDGDIAAGGDRRITMADGQMVSDTREGDHMNLITLPLCNLAAQRLRSGLTNLGIAVAVGAFIALTGLTCGAQHSFDTGLGDTGADFVVGQRNSYSLVRSSVAESMAPALGEDAGLDQASGSVGGGFTPVGCK